MIGLVHDLQAGAIQYAMNLTCCVLLLAVNVFSENYKNKSWSELSFIQPS